MQDQQPGSPGHICHSTSLLVIKGWCGMWTESIEEEREAFPKKGGNHF